MKCKIMLLRQTKVSVFAPSSAGLLGPPTSIGPVKVCMQLNPPSLTLGTYHPPSVYMVLMLPTMAQGKPRVCNVHRCPLLLFGLAFHIIRAIAGSRTIEFWSTGSEFSLVKHLIPSLTYLGRTHLTPYWICFFCFLFYYFCYKWRMLSIA